MPLALRPRLVPDPPATTLGNTENLVLKSDTSEKCCFMSVARTASMTCEEMFESRRHKFDNVTNQTAVEHSVALELYSQNDSWIPNPVIPISPPSSPHLFPEGCPGLGWHLLQKVMRRVLKQREGGGQMVVLHRGGVIVQQLWKRTVAGGCLNGEVRHNKRRARTEESRG